MGSNCGRQTSLTESVGSKPYRTYFLRCETISKVAARMPRRHLNLLKRFARSKLEIFHHKEVLAPYTTWGGEDEWVGLFFLRLESFLA